MFGIGLPELIVIFAVALIVVGPDKLPDLAKTLAKHALELKKAAQSIKNSLHEEDIIDKEPWKKISPENPQIADHIPQPPLEQDKTPPLNTTEQSAPSDNESPFQPYVVPEQQPPEVLNNDEVEQKDEQPQTKAKDTED